MISKELSEKLLAVFREIGVMKLTVFVIVILLGYQLMGILEEVLLVTTYTQGEHFIAIMMVCNFIVILLIYVAYMYDHMFASIRKVFP